MKRLLNMFFPAVMPKMLCVFMVVCLLSMFGKTSFPLTSFAVSTAPNISSIAYLSSDDAISLINIIYGYSSKISNSVQNSQLYKVLTGQLVGTMDEEKAIQMYILQFRNILSENNSSYESYLESMKNILIESLGNDINADAQRIVLGEIVDELRGYVEESIGISNPLQSAEETLNIAKQVIASVTSFFVISFKADNTYIRTYLDSRSTFSSKDDANFKMLLDAYSLQIGFVYNRDKLNRIAEFAYQIEKAYQNYKNVTLGAGGVTVTPEPTSVFEYTYVSGGISITKYNANSIDVCIPSVINGIQVVSIGDSAFWCDRDLNSVTIPSGVTSLGYAAFGGCTNLKSIYMPNSITSIGINAFTSCNSITNIQIGYNVSYIGTGAFGYCTNLKAINVDTYNSNFSSKDGVLFNKDKTTLLKYPIGNERTNYIIPNTVTCVAMCAFENCAFLISLSVPNGLEVIENWAFAGCDGLKSLILPDSIQNIGRYSFYNCYSLSKINIPNKLTIIDYRTFSGCRALTDISIPNSVTSIADSAFEGSTSLINVTIPDSVTSIGDGAFAMCKSLISVTIPDSVISIGRPYPSVGLGVFMSCTSLTNVSLGRGLTSIKDGMFGDCKSLIYIDLPDNITSIGDFAFAGCENLSNITIPNNVSDIKSYAFVNCSSLVSVFIPNGVTSIGTSAFLNCSSLLKLKCYSDNFIKTAAQAYAEQSSISYVALNGSIYNDFVYIESEDKVTLLGYKGTEDIVTVPSRINNKSVKDIYNYAFYGLTRIATLNIPNTITSIGNSAFSNCNNLSTIMGATSVANIGTGAFSKCVKLKSIHLGDVITSIETNTFYDCSELTNIIIPDSVINIGSRAFYGCSKFTSATFSGNAPTTFGSDVFSNVATNFKIYYNQGANGFTIPIWKGYNTEIFVPNTNNFRFSTSLVSSTLTNTSGVVTGDVTLIINNDSGIIKNLIVLVGIYDENNKLLSTKNQAFDMHAGENEIFLNNIVATGSTIRKNKVKIVLWDSLNTIKPMAMPIAFDIL